MILLQKIYINVMEIILQTYLIISAILAFATALFMIENKIEGIDSFWDWIIYNLFWIFQPIKAIIKFLTKTLWK